MNWKFWIRQEAPVKPLGPRTAIRLESPRDGSASDFEDRAEVLEHNGMLVLIVADGGQVLPGGARASDKVVEIVRQAINGTRANDEADVWQDRLRGIDRLICKDAGAGETSAIVAVVSGRTIVGASAGEAGAWIVAPDGKDDVTRHQNRKPLLGSGAASPVAFEGRLAGGTLLLASNGLFKYADAEKICAAARDQDLETAADRLVDLARAPSGKLQDDLAIVLCR